MYYRQAIHHGDTKRPFARIPLHVFCTVIPWSKTGRIDAGPCTISGPAKAVEAAKSVPAVAAISVILYVILLSLRRWCVVPAGFANRALDASGPLFVILVFLGTDQ